MTTTATNTAPTPPASLTPATWVTETSADVTALECGDSIRINYDGDSHGIETHAAGWLDGLSLNLTQEVTITNGVVDPGVAVVHLTIGLSYVDLTSEQARAMAALLTRLASDLDG
jgi:hypothetical protein